jgi:predicted RND superfamily exporter protein
VAGAVLTAGLLLGGIQIDTDPESMLRADQADRVFHDLVKKRFTLHDAIVVGLVNEDHAQGIYNARSLADLHALTRSILQIEGVVASDLMSLAESDNITQGAGGALRFEWMMKTPPADDEQALLLRPLVERLPLMLDTLVSGDGRAAAIYVPLYSKDLSYPVSVEIERLARELGVSDDLYVTGLPVAEDTFGVEMFKQMAISAPMAGLMIFLLMLYFFRSWQLTLAPMLVAMATVACTMGTLVGSGFTVHIMSSMIPIFLMPIAVVDSVHILSEFADRYHAGVSPADVIAEVVDELFTSMLFTSLTSAVGFASLVLTPIPPVQVFGAFVAMGVLIAFLLTVTFIPAWVVLLKPSSLAALARVAERSRAAGSETRMSRVLKAGGAWAVRRRYMVGATAIAIVVISLAGVVRININDNPVRWFKTDHRIRVADRVLNQHFAGTYDAFLVLEQQDNSPMEKLYQHAILLADKADSSGADTTGIRRALGSSAVELQIDALVSAADDALFDAAPPASPPLESLLLQAEQARSESRYFQQPAALALIEDLQGVLAKSGLVGKTNALPDVVKVVNRELHGGDQVDYELPASAAGVAQALLQYQSSHRPRDLWHIVTPDLRSTAVWIQFTSGDNQDVSRVTDAVDSYLADNPLPAGLTARWAGKSWINVVWQGEMVAGMLKSLGGAFVAVFVMMVFLFRSLRLGLVAMAPLTMTIIAVYGFIGWSGRDYDMPTAVLSSLTLGLSVDFAIHFIQRMRALSASKGSVDAATRLVMEEPARAIARNAVVIAFGFTPLLMAPLVPYITVGAFMASIMAVSALVTLAVMPSLVGWALRAVEPTQQEESIRP